MDRFLAMAVFVKVVETGSFTKAAERLDMSTTAVSRHVSELERHLHGRLLNRSTRRLSLTDTGRAFYERSVQILADVDEAEALAGAAAARPTGVLKVNMPVSFGIRHLAPLVPDYLARYPEVSLDMSLTDRVVDLVEEGYDLAVRIGRELHTSLVARRVAPARVVPCAAPAYLQRHGTPRVPEDLAGHVCLVYTYTGEEWQFDGPDGRHTVRVKGSVRANNGDMLAQAALAGMGIILQPTFLAGDDLASGHLVPLLPGYEAPPFWVYAVYPSRRHVSAKVRTFVDFLVERFGDEPAWDAWRRSSGRAGKGRAKLRP